MTNAPLTSDDWLDLALIELKERGYDALKAQPLAKKLNVTRGSFYYHFDSLESFHAAVIAHWAKHTTGRVVDGLQRSKGPQDALNRLLQKTLSSGEDLERAIRSWSTVQPLVAQAVENVDLERIKVAEAILLNGGLSKSDAAPRAKLLYWAAIGRLMLPFPGKNRLATTEVSDLAMLMLRPG